MSYRVTGDADRGCPLMCEELKAPAAACQLAFPAMPTKPAAQRAPAVGPDRSNSSLLRQGGPCCRRVLHGAPGVAAAVLGAADWVGEHRVDRTGPACLLCGGPGESGGPSAVGYPAAMGAEWSSRTSCGVSSSPARSARMAIS